MHGLVTLFLEVIALAIILLVVELVVPHVLVVGLITIMVLIVSMMIIRSAIIAGNGAASSLIHGYVLEEHEPYSFLLAASCPWQSSQEC